MLPSMLQDNTWKREELRIAAKREANEGRRKRFLNARARLIGLDVAALDQQVADKQRVKSHEKESERLERQRQVEVQSILDGYAEDDKRLRLTQRKELTDNWKTAMLDKQKRSYEDHHHPASLSGMMKFSGEDEDHDARVRAQQAQMKRWVQEQMDMKAHHHLCEKQQDEKYFEMMKAIDEIRLVAEQEEEDMRRYLVKEIHDDNQHLAHHQRQQRYHENHIYHDTNHDEMIKSTSLNIDDVDANGRNAVDAYGRIMRRDLFRGYTDAQKQRIYEDNQQIIMEKKKQQEEVRQYNEMWVEHEAMLHDAMEQHHVEETALRDAMKQQQVITLKQQMQEQAEAKRASESLKRGAISPEFFANFGTSCR